MVNIVIEIKTTVNFVIKLNQNLQLPSINCKNIQALLRPRSQRHLEREEGTNYAITSTKPRGFEKTYL